MKKKITKKGDTVSEKWKRKRKREREYDQKILTEGEGSVQLTSS